MANVALVLAIALVVTLIVTRIRRSTGIVAQRGTGIRQDLGTMSDRPRIRVRSVTVTAPERVHLVLTPLPRSSHGGDSAKGDADPDPDADPEPDPDPDPDPDLDFDVILNESAFGFALLNQWQESQCSIAIVTPPGTRILRLRSIDDLQPLTLSCVDRT